MATYTDKKRIGDVLKREWDKLYNRETVTLLAGQVVELGEVLSKVDVATTASSAAKAGGNTGDGAMGTVTPGSGAVAGVYTVRIVEAAANGGRFEVKNPNGQVVGEGNVGVAFSGGGLGFTLADGGTDFIVGDGFDITVGGGSGKYVSYNNEGTAGADAGDVIALEAVDATDADSGLVVLARGPAVVARGSLVFGAGVTTDAERDAAYADLEAKGIVIRDEVTGAPVAI